MAWGEIADVSVELEQEAEAAKNSQLVQRAVQLREQSIAIILAVDIEGSSPRMSLATDLERLARRAGKVGQFDYSVRLYRRAIEFRDLVRAKDPSNAECQCGIARDYSAIGEIEKDRKKLDDAIVAYQRALHIYEDLQKLEPEKSWNIWIAETARTLAEVLGERGERSALLHAQRAASVYGEYASRHSAESTTRIEYAKALELVSQFARAVANSEKPSDTKSAEEHFELSVSNRLEANAIRKSVLAVDPSNGECRCHVGTNLQEIALIYLDWGKKDEALQTLNRAVRVNREVLEKQPSQPLWRYDLATSLLARATAIGYKDQTQYQAIVQNVKEASNLMRPLLKVKDLPDAKDKLMSCLVTISFNALFLLSLA